jgi:hypothetical protein
VTAPFADRDGEIEAFIVDRYLESLLARQPGDPDGIPAALRATAQRLTSELPRFHPSFRFEERLALRLAQAAAAMRLPVAAGGENVVVPLADRRSPPAAGEPARTSLVPASERAPVPRPVVIGSVLTSAALSVAGAAFVVWRRSRPPTDPMRRAVRAVSRSRPV